MERMERVNSSFDLEYDYYRKNLPALEKSTDSDDLYEKIFKSRKTFTILGLDSYIVLDKKSLNKIADMIDSLPQEYVLFTNHQVIDEDKFEKLLDKEKDQLNPIYIPEPKNVNDIKNGYNNEEDMDDLISEDSFKISLWLYLFLILCSFSNFMFLIYIGVKTPEDFIIYTSFVSYLFGLLLFTGIYGFCKCRAHDYSGCVLKMTTFLVPISGLISIIILIIRPIGSEVFWMKIIVDIITIIIGVVLILYISGLIKRKKIYDTKKEGLLNTEETDI